MYQAEASVDVQASPQRVWDYVSNYQNFDRFMSHVEKVEMLDSNTSQWKMRGPLGIPVSWKAITTDMTPPSRLAWESTEGSLKTNGFITVAPQNSGSRVTVHVEYNPPAGALGEAVAKVFSDPQKMLEDDLEKLAEIISGWPTEAEDARPSAQANGSGYRR